MKKPLSVISSIVSLSPIKIRPFPLEEEKLLILFFKKSTVLFVSAHFESRNENELKLDETEINNENAVFHEELKPKECVEASDNETTHFGDDDDGPDGDDTFDDDESDPNFQGDEDKSDSGKKTIELFTRHIHNYIICAKNNITLCL